MFRFTESVRVDAPAENVWKRLTDIERWWLPSNPEHIRLDVQTCGQPIGVGTKISFEERVAGLRGRAEGEITKWTPGEEAAWQGEAEYRHLGFRFRIREGVSWRVGSDSRASILSAQVWAKFPSSIFGRFLEWYAKSLLNVVNRDREHARRELEYLKNEIEQSN